MNSGISNWSVPLTALLLLAGCDAGGPTVTQSSSLPEDTLVTVNGKPITELDLQLQLAKSRADVEIDANLRRRVVEILVKLELNAQQAMALGLDADPDYQEALRARMAQLEEFRRARLAELYRQRELAARAAVTDEEVEAHFEEYRDRLLTEFQVARIMRRDEREIEQDFQELQEGASFDEVAAKPFPDMPSNAPRPWVLDHLRWHQLPPSWVGTVDQLEEGATSGIIRGEGNRFWIVKLLERRPIGGLSVANQKERIREILQRERLERVREESDEALRSDASIVYLKEPG